MTHVLKFYIFPILFSVVFASCQSSSNGSATITAEPTLSAIDTANRTTEPSSSPTDTPIPQTSTPETLAFNGDEAFTHIENQLALGPRWPGSPGHLDVRDYIRDQATQLGWTVEGQDFIYQGFEAQNLIARANQGEGPVIIFGAHYDTRRIADQTPNSEAAVPGAVDGASGVAVLLELARTLNLEQIPREIWLAFFDVEDNGSNGIIGWDWIAGSAYMADNLTIEPEAVIVVDMVGDTDQQLYYEGNSSPELQQELWTIAAELGYEDFFIPTIRHTMIDDHLPFRRRGWVAIDIIDFDYPYWHTIEDTADKASPDSLARVGHTLQEWLEHRLE